MHLASEFIREVILGLQEDDFQFTVTTPSRPWDVYGFRLPAGELGQLALALEEDDAGERQVQVGFWRLGIRTEEEITKLMIEAGA